MKINTTSIKIYLQPIQSHKSMSPFKIVLLVLFFPIILSAQTPNDSSQSNWTLHFQQTVVGQYHPDFRSPYSGLNSQNASGEPSDVTITSTIFLGRRLWQGGEFYFN